MSHDIIPDILPYITPDIGSEMISYLVQDGLVPPLDKEASGIITVSEEIIKAYASSSKHSLNARAINDLIKDVMKNPAFGNLSCLAGLRISVPRDLNTVILTLSRRLHTAQTTRTYF